MLSHFKVFEHPQGVRVQVLHTDMVFPGITIERIGDAWREHSDNDVSICDAFSFLTTEQLEFFTTGLLPMEYKELVEGFNTPVLNDA